MDGEYRLGALRRTLGRSMLADPHAGARLTSVSAVLAMPFGASAQVSSNLERAPTLSIGRYWGDRSSLADAANHEGHWTEPFKYLPLNDDGTIYLSIGVTGLGEFDEVRAPVGGTAMFGPGERVRPITRKDP